MAATAQTITELNNVEIEEMINQLSKLDENVAKKVDYVMNNFGQNKKNALEYVVTNNPVLWAKVYLDWEARDYQFAILTEGKRSKKLVLRLGRRLGKCLTGDTLIPDSVTGEYISIEDLYKKQQASVFALNTDSLKIEKYNTNIVTDNGIKPVFKLTTKSGREIVATGNHPFYTMNGFMELDDLSVGDYVSIAAGLNHSNPTPIDEDIIKFLAYMISDGTCTTSWNLRFSCHKDNTKVLNEMNNICNRFDCKMFQYESDADCDYHIKGNKKSTRSVNNNYMSKLIQDYNLYGKDAFSKTIPNEIFKLDKEQLKIFISRLYATDGWATSSLKEKGRIEIGYCSSSKTMLVQLQSLLLRFGINSILQRKDVKYKGTIRVSYILGIYSINDVLNFCHNIGIYSKEEAVKKVQETALSMNDYGFKIPTMINTIIEEELNTKGISRTELRNQTGYKTRIPYDTVTSSKVLDANSVICSDRIAKILYADIYWDQITAIEYVGEEQTYDFTVPEYHNFVANDFITHNTDDMCVLILWFAYTQYNRGDNNQYDIVIATPYETQIDLIFKRLHQLIEKSPVLQSLITRDVNHHIGITVNGIQGNIIGFTAGANNSSGGGNSTRGQRADVLILDEADYIGSSQITNILNIRNEAPDRIRLICASTPSGKHEEYYRWCVNASKSYRPKPEDIKENQFTGYIIETKEIGEGNGWTEIYAPSNVNKELLKINPDTEQTYLEDIRDELSEMRYVQEVMAEFGEEELGVYQKKYIQAAIEEGSRIGFKYITQWNKEDRKKYLDATQDQNIRILGVDWDKYSAATNMVCMEFDRFHQAPNGAIIPVFKMLFRVEIARAEFTYINAMNKIIELNDEYKFDWIGIDRGYGEVQLELLHKYGIEHPETGLADKVIGYQFSQKIEVMDPYTRKKDQKHLKPFMVNNSVNLFEKYKIVLNPNDKSMVSQLEEYRVKSISASGLPVYTDENEHAIDAMNLALLLFEQKYNALLKKVVSIKTAFIGLLDNRETDVKSRDFDSKKEDDQPVVTIIPSSDKNGVISISPRFNRQNSRSQMFTRRKF